MSENSEGDVTKIEKRNETPSQSGSVLHAAAGYDLLIWLVTLGQERAFREEMLRLAHLKPGETVLDVGCGTGTLAIAAKRQVGITGTVYGLDASPEMIARAQKKARKAGVEVVFKKAFAQSLPFPDSQFDVVVTTVMLHHLPRKARQELAVEMRRVLKPAGRVLAIDFAGTARERKSLLDHFHHRHGHVELKDLIALLNESGLNIVESGAVGMRDLQFVLATTPGCAYRIDDDQTIDTMKGHSPRGRRWILPVIAVILIGGHGIILYYFSSHLALSFAVVLGLIILLVVKHLGLFAGAFVPLYTLFRRRSRD
jgi:ubiquinone/menaquinone biosynthesis C-methylase UbiE